MKKEIYIGREELADGSIIQEAAFTTLEAANDYLEKCMQRSWYEKAIKARHENGWTCERTVKRDRQGSTGKYEVVELERRELHITALELNGEY